MLSRLFGIAKTSRGYEVTTRHGIVYLDKLWDAIRISLTF